MAAVIESICSLKNSFEHLCQEIKALEDNSLEIKQHFWQKGRGTAPQPLFQSAHENMITILGISFFFISWDVTGDYLKATSKCAPKPNTASLFSEFMSLLFAYRKL